MNRQKTEKQSAPKRRQSKRTAKSMTPARPDTPEQADAGASEGTPEAALPETTEEIEPLPLTQEEDDQLDDVLDEIEQRFAEPEGIFPQSDEWYELAVAQDGDLPTMAEGNAHLHAQENAALRPAGATGNLIAHCGTRKISREELAQLPVPEATRTHQPIAHHLIVEALIESLTFRHIAVIREEYAVSPDGGRMFGVLDLNAEWNGVRFSIGIRNANDKSMRLGMTVGYRVVVCDNMMFKGDFTPVLYKHTRKLDLLDVISVGVDRMQRSFEPLRAQIQSWQGHAISDEQAKLLIYRAFLEDRFPRTIMAEVHRHYFEPDYEAFSPRTLWSLSNAFTSAFKLLKPVRQFTATAKLGSYLEANLNTFARIAA